MARNVTEVPSEELVAEAKQARGKTRNPFVLIALFFRQVLAELRKVVTPTRTELWRYTLIVLAFVVIMMAIVYGLDQLFSWAVIYVFGTPS